MNAPITTSARTFFWHATLAIMLCIGCAVCASTAHAGVPAVPTGTTPAGGTGLQDGDPTYTWAANGYDPSPGKWRVNVSRTSTVGGSGRLLNAKLQCRADATDTSCESTGGLWRGLRTGTYYWQVVSSVADSVPVAFRVESARLAISGFRIERSIHNKKIRRIRVRYSTRVQSDTARRFDARISYHECRSVSGRLSCHGVKSRLNRIRNRPKGDTLNPDFTFIHWLSTPVRRGTRNVVCLRLRALPPSGGEWRTMLTVRTCRYIRNNSAVPSTLVL